MIEPSALYSDEAVTVTREFLRVGAAVYPIQAISGFQVAPAESEARIRRKQVSRLIAAVLAVVGLAIVSQIPLAGIATFFATFVFFLMGQFNPDSVALIVSLNSGERAKVPLIDQARTEKLAAALEQAIIPRR